MSAGAQPRVALDIGASSDTAGRLAAVETRIGSLLHALSALLDDVDAAVGSGAPADAFRRGFSTISAEAVDALAASAALLDARRRGMVAGVEALADADDRAAAFAAGEHRA